MEPFDDLSIYDITNFYPIELPKKEYNFLRLRLDLS